MLYVGVLLGLGFEPRLDALVLLVEVGHVRHKILLDKHVRQGVHLHGGRVLPQRTNHTKPRGVDQREGEEEVRREEGEGGGGEA